LLRLDFNLIVKLNPQNHFALAKKKRRKGAENGGKNGYDAKAKLTRASV
jgi:hypothetical protein